MIANLQSQIVNWDSCMVQLPSYAKCLTLAGLDAGLKRSGKSCRLRWVNYLRPDLKRGKITPQEESVILELHALWGNR